MFNLFKTKQDQKPAAKNAISIEEQIYNDVYSAQELILQEAKRVLAIPPVFDNAKAERLRQLEKLGFKNFDEVKKLKEEREQQKKHSELNAMINYYRKVYPFHRFISQDSVQVIIKKYSLLLAKAGDYIAEIPEKNQQEIINFKVRRKDIRVPTEMEEGWSRSFMPSYYDLYGDRSLINCFDAIRAQESGDPIQYYKDLEKKKRQDKLAYERELLPGEDLLIIAPVKKLDTRDRLVKDGVLINKDPIVLQPVVLGYLIVSSWGLEASDPLVVNSINN